MVLSRRSDFRDHHNDATNSFHALLSLLMTSILEIIQYALTIIKLYVIVRVLFVNVVNIAIATSNFDLNKEYLLSIAKKSIIFFSNCVARIGIAKIMWHEF